MRKRIILGTAGVIILAAVVTAVYFWPKKSPPTPVTSGSPVLGLTAETRISGVVIPHHQLVATERQKTLAKVAKLTQPKTIILVSPNHYDAGSADIQTTSQTWNITSGTLEPDTSTIDKLKASGIADTPASFISEHGIYLVVDNLHQDFPDAKVVPIILKTKTTDAEVANLHDTLAADCPNCLMIASVDFSHYQPALLANLHDDLSIRALENLDGSLAYTQAEVDSPAAIDLLIRWADSHGTKQFHLDNHTDSDIITGDLNAQGTSHVYGWFQTGKQTVPDDQVSFTIGGDMMFARGISSKFLTGGLTKSVANLGNRLFWGTDAGIINLEGPVSAATITKQFSPTTMVFDFPPETISVLKYLHINVASQANNHSANQGTAGYATTVGLLNTAGIQAVGGPSDSDVTKVATIKGQNLNLVIIGVLTLADTPDLTSLIKQYKADPKNRVIIFPHWGNEYQPLHSSGQAHDAHVWIDAGADAVIGAHPHVIEDAEVYNGKPVFYSLGNLLFDQDWSAATQKGLILSGEFTDKGLTIFALPTQLTKDQPALMTGAERGTIINSLYQPFASQLQDTPAGKILFFPNA